MQNLIEGVGREIPAYILRYYCGRIFFSIVSSYKEGAVAYKRMFSYLYYRVYEFYHRRHDLSADVFAAWIVAVMQFLNVICMLFLLCLFANICPNFGGLFGVILFLTMLGFNFYYYSRREAIQKLVARWQNEPILDRTRHGLWVVLYLLLSLLVPLFLASILY